MTAAPYCNVTVATPEGSPHTSKGLQHIPPGANLQQITNIVNNNFRLLGGNFLENRAARETTITRIYDPGNPSVWVDVRQITNVQWGNPAGQTIVWRR